MIELTFADDDTSDSILNSGLVPPNRVLEAVKNGKHHFCSISSRVLTVQQGENAVATAEDYEHEPTPHQAASARWPPSIRPAS